MHTTCFKNTSNLGGPQAWGPAVCIFSQEPGREAIRFVNVKVLDPKTLRGTVAALAALC